MSIAGDGPTIMVLDDEQVVLDLLRVRLEPSGYTVLTAASYQEFTNAMTDCDAVLCDIILGDASGLEALKWTHEHYVHTPVIMMTGEPSFQTAAEAIRLGAYDYLAKPIQRDELIATLARAVEHRRLTLEKKRLEAENEVYRDELEQRIAERTQALRASQEFLENLTETMADAVLSLKMPGGQIEYVNKAVTQIFGYQADELLGQTAAMLHPSRNNFEAFLKTHMANIASGQYQAHIEQLLRRKDGQTIWTEMATTFVKTANGSGQLIMVVRDMAQRSLLLSIVAHELRAPLALLTGFSETLIEDIADDKTKDITRYLDIVHRVSTRLMKMLDELLNVTTIELGKLPMEIERVELNEFLLTQVSDYGHLATQKNITLKTDLPSDPLVCPCDPIQISQVVSNLIDNALKYSGPATTVELTGQIRPGEIWIGVKDEGPGIEPAETPFLFQSFGHKKINTVPTAGEKSTGLGLAICKRVIETHGGQIGVDSTPGQGSTFWFSLPR